MIYRLVIWSRRVGVLLVLFGLATVLGMMENDMPRWGGLIMIVVGTLLGMWAHGIITRAMSRPVTQEEADRWLRGEK